MPGPSPTLFTADTVNAYVWALARCVPSANCVTRNDVAEAATVATSLMAPPSTFPRTR